MSEKKFNNETEFVFSNEFAGFTTIPNYIFNVRTLSFKAVGIYCQILQFQNSPDHKIYIKSLTALKSDGKASVAAGLQELIEAGFLSKEQLRDSKGKMAGIRYTVYMKPIKSIDSTENRKSESGEDTLSLSENRKPEIGKSEIGKSDTYKENKDKKKISKKENKSSSSVPSSEEDEDVITLYKDYRGIKRLSKSEKELLLNLITSYGNEKVIAAIKVGIRKANKPNFAYIESVCINGISVSTIKKESSTVNAVPKNNTFTRTYSHNWDMAELERREMEYIEKMYGDN